MADYTDGSYEEQGFAMNPISQGYTEGPVLRASTRFCGACCFVLLGMLALAWTAHAFNVADADVPPLARSLVWMSIAHHTWADAPASPPPPLRFLDGSGN